LQQQPLTQLLPQPNRPRQLTKVITLEPKAFKQPQLIGPLAVFRPQIRPMPQGLPELPAQNTFRAQKTDGYISRLGGHNLKDGNHLQIELPFGTPRRVNVATLKRLLGGSPTDALLRKTGSTWSICDDGMQVDLLDPR